MTVKRDRKLRQVIAAGTSPQPLVLRARIVLAAAAGVGTAQIARDLGCSVSVGGRKVVEVDEQRLAAAQPACWWPLDWPIPCSCPIGCCWPDAGFPAARSS